MRSFTKANKVLLVGSAPDAVRIKQWDLSPFDAVVVINNAWQLTPHWHYHIFPEDFPPERQPQHIHYNQQVIDYTDYVPAQNQFGGFVYAGGTMAFTAAYWALAALKPSLLAFIGCDMIYANNRPTHFYGEGTADPLRDDITLHNLEAKATRLQALAAENNCYCANLSDLSLSRLVFPKFTLQEVVDFKAVQAEALLSRFDDGVLQQAKAKEATLKYFVASGEYWKCLERFDVNELKQLDQQWLSAVKGAKCYGKTV